MGVFHKNINICFFSRNRTVNSFFIASSKKKQRSICPLLSRGQFHQHFLHTFFIQKSFLAAFSSYVLALAKNLYKKRAHLMLMKLTVGVNFIKVMKAAFMHSDPKNAKKDSQDGSVVLRFCGLQV